MRIIFNPPARVELIEAEDWYEAQQPKLGLRFRAEVEAVVAHGREFLPIPYGFPGRSARAST